MLCTEVKIHKITTCLFLAALLLITWHFPHVVGWFRLTAVTSRVQVLWCHTPTVPLLTAGTRKCGFAGSTGRSLHSQLKMIHCEVAASSQPPGDPAASARPRRPPQTQAGLAHGSGSAMCIQRASDCMHLHHSLRPCRIRVLQWYFHFSCECIQNVVCLSTDALCMNPTWSFKKSRWKTIFANQLFVDAFECW